MTVQNDTWYLTINKLLYIATLNYKLYKTNEVKIKDIGLLYNLLYIQEGHKWIQI